MRLKTKLKKILSTRLTYVTTRAAKRLPTRVLEGVVWVGYHVPRTLKLPIVGSLHTAAFFEYGDRLEPESPLPAGRKSAYERKTSNQAVGCRGVKGRTTVIEMSEPLESYPIPRHRPATEIDA
jgi:hypothetical protein